MNISRKQANDPAVMPLPLSMWQRNPISQNNLPPPGTRGYLRLEWPAQQAPH